MDPHNVAAWGSPGRSLFIGETLVSISLSGLELSALDALESTPGRVALPATWW